MDEIVGSGFSVTLYLLASLVFFVDLLDILLRLYLRRLHTFPLKPSRVPPTSVPLSIGEFSPYEMRLHLRPYALLVSVHNAGTNLDRFLADIEPLRGRLWVVDDASTDDTWPRLQRAGVRCLRIERNQRKPGAIKALLAALPPDVATVVILDPDCRIRTSSAELEQVLFQFQRSEMAALCPRVAIRTDGWLSRLQQLEYWLAFSLGRKSLADFTITSGIAVYRIDALRGILDQHSLSVYAEDLENALILLSHGERVYYDGRLIVETDGMPTIGRLFSQRVGWHFGLLRVYVDHWRGVLSCARGGLAVAYQFVIYMGVFVLLFHPLKVLGLPLLAVSAVNGVDNLLGLQLLPDTTVTNPLYFAALYVKYTALVAAIIPLSVGRRERMAVLPVVPIYAFYALGLVVPSAVGYANWFSIRLWGRRVYRDHYQPAST